MQKPLLTPCIFPPYNEIVGSLLILFLICAVILVMGIWWLRQKIRDELKEKTRLLSVLHKLYTIMISLVTLEETAQKLTDAIAFELGFKAGVLSLVDESTQSLKRVAVSQTEAGKIGIKMLPVPYKSIGTPLNYDGNLLIKALREKKPQMTTNMYDLFIPNLSPELAARLQSVMGITTSMVYPVFSKDKAIGTMIFSISGNEKDISNIQKEGMKRILEVVGLVIDRVYVYEKLAKTSESLRLANRKLEELDQLKDDFVSVASHELRTPMTAIRSYAWMALNRPDISLSEKMKKYLSRTLISTERLINLVNDMLNVSRIESGRVEIKPAVFDISALVEDVMTEVGPKAAEKTLHLQVNKAQIPQVFADQDKVHQVLLNLIGNSLKFTQNGGLISASFFTDGQIVEVAIKDNGVGISQDDLGRLFKKFGRLDNSYVAAATSGGTGLGLYIARSLVELSGGKIWATSEGLGKGTTFTFSLPVATPAILSQAEKFTRKVEGEAKVLEPVAI